MQETRVQLKASQMDEGVLTGHDMTNDVPVRLRLLAAHGSKGLPADRKGNRESGWYRSSPRGPAYSGCSTAAVLGQVILR